MAPLTTLQYAAMISSLPPRLGVLYTFSLLASFAPIKLLLNASQFAFTPVNPTKGVMPPHRVQKNGSRPHGIDSQKRMKSRDYPALPYRVRCCLNSANKTTKISQKKRNQLPYLSVRL
ncbi:hypothetical protein DM02DRAFT_614151, partial [Periconia macrospinosa]